MPNRRCAAATPREAICTLVSGAAKEDGHHRGHQRDELAGGEAPGHGFAPGDHPASPPAPTEPSNCTARTRSRG
jgi:hypothetical protein